MRRVLFGFAAVVLFALSCQESTPRPPSASSAAFAVAAYGDSLTHGGGAGPSGWPRYLRSDWVRFNGGIDNERAVPKRTGSQTLITGTLRPTSAPDLSTLAATWDVVVLFWGTNDVVYPGYADELSDPASVLAANDPITDEDVMGSLEGAVITLRATGLRVIVVWPPPLLEGYPDGSIANQRLLRIRNSPAPAHRSAPCDVRGPLRRTQRVARGA